MKASNFNNTAQTQYPLTTAEQIEEALQHISPDMERDEWAKIAMAIKSEMGEYGITLFDVWSQGADNYKAADTKSTWRSINGKGGIGIGTLFHRAKEGGYQPQHKTLTPAEQTKIARQATIRAEERKAAEAQEQVDREAKQKAAAKLARKRWEAADAVDPSHPYLTTKGVTGVGLRQSSNALLVPMRDETGTIWNIERITEPGMPKKGLTGGRRKGLFANINGKDVLVIAEGYATAASIHAATGWTSMVAFGKGNLEAIARMAREHMPDTRIIIAGDVGSEKHARHAAAAINAEVAIPPLSDDGADFNDLHLAEGLDAVKQALDASEAVSEWPEITPLNTTLPLVEPFKYKLLPDGLANWVQDITERTQCPPDFVAVTVMAALASLVGRKVSIYPMARNDWLVTPNLWGALVGRPSAMKSPAMMEGMRPLRRLAVQAKGLHEDEMNEFEVNEAFNKQKRKVLEADIRKALKSERQHDEDRARNDYQVLLKESESPTAKRYIVNDATIEKLGELLNQNSNGLLLERDELTGWLKNLDREDRANDRAFYLECFNGSGTYTYDRIGRGTLHIESTTLSLIGGLQPSRLRPYVWHAINQGAGDDGLIQRLQLIVYPDDPGEWRNVDQWPDKESRNAAFDVFQKIDEMEPLSSDKKDANGDEIKGVRFSDSGQSVFNEWRGTLERKIREPGIHPAIESHLTKYRSLMPSIALIINEVEQGHCQSVTELSAKKAAAWCQYLESHAMRIYGGAIDPAAQSAELILERRDKLPGSFKARDVQRKGWAGLSEVAHVKAALDELEECGYLRAHTLNTGGRPATSYEWNPNTEAAA